MKIKLAILLAVTLSVFTGCVGGGLGDLAKELKDDPATLRIEINSPWGVQRLERTNPHTNHTAILNRDQIKVGPGN